MVPKSADIDRQLIEIAEVAPEPIQEHWVVVGDRQYPPKQVYQLLTGKPRATFTSHRALAHLGSLGSIRASTDPDPKLRFDRNRHSMPWARGLSRPNRLPHCSLF